MPLPLLDNHSCLLQAPREVAIELTRRCNLHCPFCYVSKFAPTGRPDLPTSAWLAFLDELAEAKVLEIAFTGGEPLLYPGLRDLVRHVAALPMRYKLYSNGVLLDDETADFLANTGHCEYVQISLDGDEDTHDTIRGRGVHAAAMQTLRRLQARGLGCQINMVVTRGNCHVLAAEARRLLEEFQLVALHLSPVTGVPDPPTPKQLVPLMHEAERLQRQYPGKVAGKLFSLLASVRHPYAPDSGQPFPSCAPQLGALCAVRHDGVINPCISADEIALGNVQDGNFLELWRNSPLWHSCRERVTSPSPLPDKDGCRDCRHQWECRRTCLKCSSPTYCLRDIADQLNSSPTA